MSKVARQDPRNLSRQDKRAIVDFRQLFAYTLRGRPYSRCCQLFEVTVHKAAAVAAELARECRNFIVARPREQFFPARSVTKLQDQNKYVPGASRSNSCLVPFSSVCSFSSSLRFMGDRVMLFIITLRRKKYCNKRFS